MPQKPTSVSDLLGKAGGMLERLREGAGAADRVLGAVQDSLPAGLGRQVWGATVRDGVLTVLVSSAGWATRIRYQAATLQESVTGRLGVKLERTVVKVRPVGGR